MDRLTIRIQDDGCGNQIVTHHGHRFGRALYPSEAAYGEYIELLERLAEYEDTGLTPEQLIEIDRLYTEMCREVQRYRWIPVADMLPTPGDTVLAYIKHNYAEDDWRAYRVYQYTDHWVGMGNLCEVLAWMPLSEPFNI